MSGNYGSTEAYRHYVVHVKVVEVLRFTKKHAGGPMQAAHEEVARETEDVVVATAKAKDKKEAIDKAMALLEVEKEFE